MSATVPFTFLRVRPDEVRGEQLNIGLVFFLEHGPEVHIDAPSWRVRAIHPDLDIIDWGAWASELESVLADLPSLEDQLSWIQRGLGAVCGDATLGHLQIGPKQDVQEAIAGLLEQVVSLPDRTLGHATRTVVRPKSRLHTQLRSWFRASKVFSPRVSDLSKSKVVPSYPIDVSGDLYADFALRNGAIHIIEALDFRGAERITKTLRGEASLAAVLFDQSRKVLEVGSKRIAVTAADDHSLVKPLVALVSKYADDVLCLESRADRQRLADFVSSSLKVETDLLRFPATSSEQ